jgi:hypothetical protein
MLEHAGCEHQLHRSIGSETVAARDVQKATDFLLRCQLLKLWAEDIEDLLCGPLWSGTGNV